MSVGAQNTARKSKERSSSVTFREDVKSVDGNTPADGQMKGSSTERKLLRGADSLLEADEDGNADMRFVVYDQIKKAVFEYDICVLLRYKCYFIETMFVILTSNQRN